MGAPAVEDIARVLLGDWDPLGVAESDEAPKEEYRFEARELSAMLAQGTSAEAIADYPGSRGLGAPERPRDRAAATALLVLVEQSHIADPHAVGGSR
jgi:hypothetical protein